MRDAAFWGEIFYHLYNEFGDEAVAVFQGHGIPHFKSEDDPDNVSRYLLDNAAAYKFPNDEALLLANKGVKLQDIGRKINIPDRISKTWYTRDHYGNYTFNARGAVNRILGFYDGNPVNLWPLEETEYAARFVEYAGGEDEALKKAEQDFARGDYQWVASAANYIVMSNSDNKKARYLGADALEQLAYQTQTGLWRNMYLTGAYELRNPNGKKNAPHLMDNSEVMPYVNAGLLFDYLGINFDGEKGIDLQEKFIIEITDTDDAEKYVVTLYKGTLLYDRLSGQKNTEQLTSVKLSRTQLYQLSSAKLGAEAFDGQTDDGRRIISLIQDNITDTAVYSDFNIIEPLAQ